jgi:hypothetical protein
LKKNNLPRFFGLQKQILEAAANEGYEFKLCNGLPGRLYRLNNKHVKCVAEAATQVLGDLKRYLVAAVDIEDETVFIVHFKDKDVGRILPALQDFGSPDLDLVKLMVFNGQVYRRRQRGWTALQFAIQSKVKPSISIVVA